MGTLRTVFFTSNEIQNQKKVNEISSGSGLIKMKVKEQPPFFFTDLLFFYWPGEWLTLPWIN